MTMSDAGAASGLVKQGLFEPFKPDGFDKVLDDAEGPRRPMDRAAAVDRRHPDPQRQGGGGGRSQDLVRPQAGEIQRGLMVMPDPSFTADQLVVVGMLSPKLGWDFYKALRANAMIVQGHQQVFSTMQQGERVIGAEGADPRSFADRKETAQPRWCIRPRAYSSSRRRPR